MDNFEELLKQYLKEHLQIRIDCSCGYYGREEIKVKLLIDDEEISSDYYSITHS